LTQLTSGFNAYSAANVALVKAHSSQQYVTVSGDITGLSALTANVELEDTFVGTMLAFLHTSGFSGIEIDFEGFGSWKPQQYGTYKAFLVTLGNALHARGYKLMVDGPAISDATYQSYYLWKWEDFDKIPQVDYLVSMAYDYQADQGAGNPVAPLAWITAICQWMTSRITDHGRIIIGLNSYGYHSQTGSYSVTQNTYEQSRSLPGFSSARRDTMSGEMMWALNGTSYDYSDSTTLDLKLQAVQSAGITAVSVWALPGNQWFTSQPVQPSQPSPSPLPTPTLTFTQDQIKAILYALTPDQIATIKNAITGQ